MVSLMISSVSATALYSPTFTSLLSVGSNREGLVRAEPRVRVWALWVSLQALAVF